MKIALAVHGGAGALKDTYVEERRLQFERSLDQALLAGSSILNSGGNATCAVVEAVAVLEDSPLFNAGRGSVLNRLGAIEMSASVACGGDSLAGAVAAMNQIRNPVRAALKMLAHPHTVLMGHEAESWLLQNGSFDTEPADWFITDERRSQWERLREHEAASVDHDTQTVGAVARDQQGGLAAATSTGGLANQLPGRLPDTAVPGAGTWADDRTIAVSGTGNGDIFLRHAFARRLADLVELEGVSADRAAHTALAELAYLGGDGGCIAVAPRGAPIMKMSTNGMFRGLLAEDGTTYVAVFRDEPLHRPGAGLSSVGA